MKRHRRGQAMDAAACTAAATRTTVRFAAPGMDCAGCGNTVRDTLRRLPGVFAVASNVSAREVAVTFDPARVDDATIQANLDALGLCER